MNPAAPVTRYRIGEQSSGAVDVSGRSPPSPSSTRQTSEKKRVIDTPARYSPTRGSGRSPFASASASSG